MILHSKILGDGVPFLILHGFLGMGDNWKSMALKLSKLGYQLHLIDQRNHGRSFHDQTFSYESMANDLKLYCEHHELKKIILLGHSMGGKTAMLFTAINPIMVAKLIVADIAPRFYPIHHYQILEGLSNLDFSIIDSRKKADIELSKYVDDFGVRQFLLKNLYWVSPGILGLRMNLKILFENVHEVGESLPSHLIINTETLFLRGDKSEYILEDDISHIADQFNNFSMKTIPNSGHWLHAENPNVFFSEILNFLS